MRSRINFTDKNIIERGFTLVELLVVIVILGILAAVVVFAVGGITNKGKSSACTIEVRTINTALQAFYANTNAYPPGTVVATGMFTAAPGSEVDLDRHEHVEQRGRRLRRQR